MDELNLRYAGVKYDDGLKRFCNNKSLYEKYIREFLNDDTFQNLQAALEKQDLKQAFIYAHNLKGISGNLSFVNIYEACFPIVETLRVESTLNIKENMLELEKAYNAIVAAIKQETATE